MKATPFRPALFWATIVATTTLGTTLADFADRSLGIGYPGGVAIVGALLAASLLIWRWSGGTVSVVAALYFWTEVSHTILFWAAFVLTRPLGATVGDLLDKPLASGGLNFSRWVASLALLVCMVACVALIPQRAARKEDAV